MSGAPKSLRWLDHPTHGRALVTEAYDARAGILAQERAIVAKADCDWDSCERQCRPTIRISDEHEALLAAAPAMVEALKAALPYLEACAQEEGSYGNFPGGDPRKFTPDPECSTEKEQAAWKAACDAMDAGTSTGESGSCLHAPGLVLTLRKFGLGVYMHADEDAVRARDAARAALAAAGVLQPGEVAR